MKLPLQINLTDFLYAVVVGSAFQRIDAPILTENNLLLLFAFAVIIDDWVLYHVQASEIKQNSNAQFGIGLALDSIVLLIWYCAAVSGAHLIHRDFTLFLCIFYMATMTWELYFARQTNNRARIIPDGICTLLFLFGTLSQGQIWYTASMIVITIIWISTRVFAWRRIIFQKIPSELQTPAHN